MQAREEAQVVPAGAQLVVAVGVSLLVVVGPSLLCPTKISFSPNFIAFISRIHVQQFRTSIHVYALKTHVKYLIFFKH